MHPPGLQDSAARRAFIRANTTARAPPQCPEITLHLADDALELWRLGEEEMGAIGLPPPFWAFAWAGGQALARYVLDNPHVVRGRPVIDFAAGSGMVAIAAMKAGAACAWATDIDLFAIDAIGLNASLNGIVVDPQARDIIGQDCPPGAIILAGDICYEQASARAVTDWLAAQHKAGSTVLIGDPGRTYLAKDRLVPIAEYQTPVMASLEDSEVKRTNVWRFR
jgi:predicted nicotinamide N-methyase